MSAALLVVASLTVCMFAMVVVAVRVARPLADPDRIDEMVEAGAGGAVTARRIVQEPDRSAGLAHLLAPSTATMWGWTVVVVARWLLGSFATTGARVALVACLGVVAVALLFVLVEALPTAAAMAAPERVLASCAVAYRTAAVVLGPVVTVVDGMAAALLFPVGMWLDGGRRRAPSADELAALVAVDLDLDVDGELDAGSRGPAGDVEGPSGGRESARAGRRLLAGALDFLDVRVRDVMAQRDHLVTVPHTATVTRAEQLVHRSGHSRVLVVGSTGEVTGFLHAKDLIGLPEEQRRGLLPAGLVRVALRVDPEDRLQEVLPRMRRARRHVAVVESDGEVQGLITLEDVLEAIVGDIRDESDLESDSLEADMQERDVQADEQ